MIELYLLEQLSTYAKLGTLSAASEALHLSQPALSRSMKKLEELLDVELFVRNKNRLELNENGKLAVEYADRILQGERDMVEAVRAFDRRNRTIRLGSCAPVPSSLLLPTMTRLYSDMTITSEIKTDSVLLTGLENGDYQFIVTHEKPEMEGLHTKKCGGEKLYIAVPPANPLYDREGVWLKDLAGQSVLLYSQIGFWYDLCMEKSPDTRYLLQNDFGVFNELAGVSALPVFITDYWLNLPAQEPQENPQGRKPIPILDPEADVEYFLVCRQEDKGKYKALFQSLG